MENALHKLRHWLFRSPTQTFIICPLIVLAVEFALHNDKPLFVPWGCLLLIWGYAQFRLVGRYRLPRSGGSPGMTAMPDRFVATGPYRFTRNPMYLGHLIFMAGLTVTFWSWFALILFTARAIWFHGRVLRDERRLAERFGGEYEAYRRQVPRWIPGLF